MTEKKIALVKNESIEKLVRNGLNKWYIISNMLKKKNSTNLKKIGCFLNHFWVLCF